MNLMHSFREKKKSINPAGTTAAAEILLASKKPAVLDVQSEEEQASS